MTEKLWPRERHRTRSYTKVELHKSSRARLQTFVAGKCWQLAKHPTAESIPSGPDVSCVLGSCTPAREEVLCTHTQWVCVSGGAAQKESSFGSEEDLLMASDALSARFRLCPTNFAVRSPGLNASPTNRLRQNVGPTAPKSVPRPHAGKSKINIQPNKNDPKI